MKRVLLLLPLAALWPVGASAGGIAGLEELHWGMTYGQVEVAYPNFESYSEKRYDLLTGQPQTETDYGLREYWAVCNFTLRLDFLDKRLGRVMLTHSETHADDCRGDLEAKLAARYGAKPLINAGSNTFSMQWEVGPTTITYAVHNWGAGSFVSLNYAEKGAFLHWMQTMVKRGGNL